MSNKYCHTWSPHGTRVVMSLSVGHYIYFEASGRQLGDRAIIVSRVFPIPPSSTWESASPYFHTCQVYHSPFPFLFLLCVLILSPKNVYPDSLETSRILVTFEWFILIHLGNCTWEKQKQYINSLKNWCGLQMHVTACAWAVFLSCAEI